MVGWIGFLADFLILSYYSVVSGWGLNYVLMSLTQSYQHLTPSEISNAFDVLYQSADINIFWHALFMLLTVGVVYQGVRAGIEYWSRIMMSGLLIILLGLFAYAMTLPGVGQAAAFVLKPDFSKLTAAGALEALGLAFFTLSLGQGIMLTYGSYMRRHDDIPKTAFLISGMVILVALLSGMTIFPIVFSFGLEPSGGEGLVFKTLPVLFAQLPGALVISTVFFILFVFAALTSAVAFLEVVVANFMDLYGWSRPKAALILGGLIFLAGIPSALAGSHELFPSWTKLYGQNFFQVVDGLASYWLLPLGGLLVALFTGWFYDKELCYQEFVTGSTLMRLYRPWRFLMRWAVPIAILLILLQHGGVIEVDKFFSF